MKPIVVLILACCACSTIDAYRLVAAPSGSCLQKMAYGIVRIQKYECSIMGGGWNGSPGHNDWIDCHLDWCNLPAKGKVASGSVWGIDSSQIHYWRNNDRTYGIVGMTRKDCDEIRGRYNNNPHTNDWIDCHLLFARKDGLDRQNVDTLVLSSVEGCAQKVAYGVIKTIHRECLQIGGRWNGDPGANDWINCHLDICLSPVIQCVPSDSWTPIQVWRNPSSNTATCSFSISTGYSREQGSSSTIGGSSSISQTISQEAGIELEGIFTSKVSSSTSFTTSFSWEQSKYNSEVWSNSKTRTIEVEVKPHTAISINQVIGMCGKYRVKTFEYSIRDETPAKK